MRAKVAEIRQFVVKNASWIVKTQRKLALRAASKPPAPHYASGEIHAYLGHPYALHVRPGDKDAITLLPDRIQVTTKGETTAERVRTLLERWHRERAETVFRERLAACRLKMPKDVPLPRLRIRSMKTRWGSFSSKGWVTLNLRLITMPVDCLDYVILHELCHHSIKGHGPRFWEFLEQFLPDCKERRKELNHRAGVLDTA